MVSYFCSICDKKINVRPHSYNKSDYVPVCWLCRTTTPPDMFRCKGTTASGTRCKKWVMLNQQTCKNHGGLKQ